MRAIKLERFTGLHDCRPKRRSFRKLAQQTEMNSAEQQQNANASNTEQTQHKIDDMKRRARTAQPTKPQGNAQSRQKQDRQHAEDAIHGDRKCGARFLARRALENKVKAHGIAADQTRQKHVEEQADHDDRESAQPAQRDPLNAQQHLPAHGRKHFDSAIGKPAEYYPGAIGVSQSIRDLCSLLRVVKYIPKSSPCHQQLKQHDADAFHTRISPRVMLSGAKHV